MLSARIVQMMSKRGFVSLFWKELKQQQRINPKVTHNDVYEKLEKEYKQAIGQRRYASFRSFRTRRDDKN